MPSKWKNERRQNLLQFSLVCCFYCNLLWYCAKIVEDFDGFCSCSQWSRAEEFEATRSRACGWKWRPQISGASSKRGAESIPGPLQTNVQTAGATIVTTLLSLQQLLVVKLSYVRSLQVKVNRLFVIVLIIQLQVQMVELPQHNMPPLMVKVHQHVFFYDQWIPDLI